MAIDLNQIKEILSEASTKSSINVDTSKVSKNALNKYASYNYLFTLSGISTSELQDCLFFNKAPHDIIAQSSGIGDAGDNIQALGDFDDDRGLRAQTSKTLSSRAYEALTRDRQILSRSRDLYFQSVEIDNFHAMNPQRGTAPVTKINMKLLEPTGLTLLNKLRASAANNGFRDHLNAPFLLTVKFAGQDELGRTDINNKDATTRYIPLRIFKCDLSVTQAGTEYDISAVAWNEFGFMDRFLVTRSNISVSKRQTLSSYMRNFQDALNSQTQDEADAGHFDRGKQDEYRIVLHPDIASQQLTPLYEGYKNLKEIEMATQSNEASEGSIDFNIGYDTKGGQIPRGTSILKILEQTVRSTDRYKFLIENWFSKTAKELSSKKGGTKLSSGDLAQYLDTDPNKYFVDWFRVKSSIEILPEFDNITKQQKKRITFYIYPYKVHVYKLAVPGASLGGAGAFQARKIYDYIFTGNNTEVLNMDIEYKYAYYQTSLKDMDPNFMSRSANITDQTSIPSTFGGSGTPDSVEPLLPLQQNVGLYTAASTGATVQNFKLVDVFMDQLTNPQADMVNIRLDIMGDPAWLSQTQFLPVKVDSSVAADENQKKLSNPDGKDSGWNTRFNSFNTDIADPIILVNFKMPVDFDDRLGIYNLKKESSGVFNGLYQVYKVTHYFDNGQFKQTLHCVRFNNQSQVSSKGADVIEFAVEADGNIITSVPKKVKLTAAGNDASPNTAGDTF